MAREERNNMPDNPENLESLLLDYHLNRLEPEQVAEVEKAIQSSEKVASQNRNLAEVTRLLDSHKVPEPPADLADSVMARINEEPAAIPFEQPQLSTVGSAGNVSAGPAISLRELTAIAACIALFVGIFVPGYFKAQNMAYRNRCKHNLRMVWEGMASYAEENQGYATYAGHVPGASWLPTRAPDVKRVSNTRPLFKLLKNKHVKGARIFICPADSTGQPMLADDYEPFDDFAEPTNVSYSFQYMNVPEGRKLEEMDPRMAWMADRNPLFDSRAAHRLYPFDDQWANSMAHGERAGQNVVYPTGQLGWYSQPNVGVNRDNIYQAGKLIRYEGTEKPTCDTDSLLVP
jgi:hypothetical protein